MPVWGEATRYVQKPPTWPPYHSLSSICILLLPTLLPSFKPCSNPSCPTPCRHVPWTLQMRTRNAAMTSALQERQAGESPLTPHMLPFHGSADVRTPCTTHGHKCHANTCPCLHTWLLEHCAWTLFIRMHERCKPPQWAPVAHSIYFI